MNKIIYEDEEIVKFEIDSPKFGKFEVIIDREDKERVLEFKWCVSCRSKRNYKVSHINSGSRKNKKVLHRIILNIINPSIIIDHKNRNVCDNRKCNLRIATNKQNMANCPPLRNNKLGIKGVSFIKDHNSFYVKISHHNKRIFIGWYKCKIEAAKAYNEAALKYHKEFAYLNPIPETHDCEEECLKKRI